MNAYNRHIDFNVLSSSVDPAVSGAKQDGERLSAEGARWSRSADHSDSEMWSEVTELVLHACDWLYVTASKLYGLRVEHGSRSGPSVERV